MKKKLLFATGNRGKFLQVSRVLAEYGIALEQSEISLVEPDLDSLKEIALGKAKQAFAQLKQPLIVEDTGFYFDAYPGFPGPHTKWAFNKIGYEGFFRLLEGKTKKCHTRTVICFIGAKGKCRFFEGKWQGSITTKISRLESASLPYARIFIGKGENIPSLEMSEEEKSKKSQRGIAAHKLGKWLKENQAEAGL
jgi:XTP/dITP diphosphohydrolase